MMFGSNVAPRRRVIDAKYRPWECKCVARHDVLKTNPGYLTRCIDCGWKREK